MAKKKKIKLKKKFRRLMIIFILIIVLSIIGVRQYKIYKYHQTNEYKLLEKGYDEKTMHDILSKLDENQVLSLLNVEKNEYIDEIINEKYFLKKNLDLYLNFYAENQDKSFNDVVAMVNVGATRDWYENTNITDVTKGYLILTNKFNLLPKEYDAGEIKTFSSTYAYGTVSAEEECYHAFIEMAKAAKKEKITLVLTSGFRTYEKQESLYNSYLKSYGKSYADAYAARPGASEHETGLALDVFNPGGTTDTFHTTDAYVWLQANAQNYGFILRYPEGKEYLTGYAPESWHYRYVGIDMAKKIKEEGITYDEYYAYYIANE